MPGRIWEEQGRHCCIGYCVKKSLRAMPGDGLRPYQAYRFFAFKGLKKLQGGLIQREKLLSQFQDMPSPITFTVKPGKG